MPKKVNAETLFTKQAHLYAQYRPGYPTPLFDYLAKLAPSRERAWDCATGNGQAAIGLAAHFNEVIATDANAEQLKHAVKHPKIVYRQATAEDSGLPSSSIDLLTVATALHWLNLKTFFSEAKRVLRPGGIFAAWCYGAQKINRTIDQILNPFEENALKNYWAAQIDIAKGEYRSVKHPFTPVPAPRLTLETEWNYSQLKGFVESWSAVQRYKDENGENPWELIELAMRRAWGPVDTRYPVRWDLNLIIGSR